MDSRFEALPLILHAGLEPVFHQDDARVDHGAFHIDDLIEELLHFLVGCESHHPFDPGAVVPTPVEDDDFTGGGKMLDVPLDVHLRFLSLGRSRQCDDPENSRD